jgi:protoporphyrinogen oxidase
MNKDNNKNNNNKNNTIVNNINNPIIIVGSGITGLFCAYHLTKIGKNVLVFEKENEIGGRAKSIQINPENNNYTIEAGAGVIRSDDDKIIDLAKELGIEMNFWKSKTDIIYHDSKTNKNELLDLDYSKIIKKVCKNSDDSKSFLNAVNYADITQKEKTGILIGTSYTELYEANSYQVCHDNDLYEFMVNDSKYEYGKPANGWTELIHALRDSIIKNQGEIYKNSSVVEISDIFVVVDFDNNSKNLRKIPFSKLYITAPMHFMKTIKLTSSLNQWYNVANELIKETDYLRVYSYFEQPLKIPNKIASNLPIRRVIPITDQLIMTAYTEGNDADMIYYKFQNKDKKLSQYIRKQLKLLLNIKTIPKIKKNWIMFWKNGISSWKPSYDNLEDIVSYLQNPVSNIYFCGDTYSMTPGWISGCLDSAIQVLSM